MPTATIYADKDVYVRGVDGSGVSVFGENETLQVGTLYGAMYGHGYTDNDSNEFETWIGFPTGGIPAGAIISAVSLNLKATNASIAGGGMRIGRHPGDFDENNSAWTTLSPHGLDTDPNVAGYETPNHDLLASTVSPAPDAWMPVALPVNKFTPGSRNAYLIWASTPTNVTYKLSYTLAYFYSSEAVTPANRPYLSVTYSEAPGAPGSISTPINGGAYDALINLFAGQATDPDTPQANLQYEWSWQKDGGAWTVIAGLTAAGTTAKAWNTSALAPGTGYKVRVRSFDGGQYGPYTTMAGTFAIYHTARVKRWSGAAWTMHNVWRWDGVAWVATKLKRWTGAAWDLE